MTSAPAFAFALAAVLGSFGCRSDLTDPHVQPSLAQGGSELPYKESYHAAGRIVSSASCPAGSLLVRLEGGGNATHVGRYRIVNSHCLDLVTGHFTNGTFVKTAPPGDQLIGTYSGSGTVLQAPAPPDLVGRFAITGTLVFTGGTGRYANAAGTADLRGLQVTDFSAPDSPTEIQLVMEGSFSW